MCKAYTASAICVHGILGDHMHAGMMQVVSVLPYANPNAPKAMDMKDMEMDGMDMEGMDHKTMDHSKMPGMGEMK